MWNIGIYVFAFIYQKFIYRVDIELNFDIIVGLHVVKMDR